MKNYSPHKTLKTTPINIKQKAISPPSQNKLSLAYIISSDPLLLSYFSQHQIQANYSQFAKKLLLDGIRYRSKDIRMKSNQHSITQNRQIVLSSKNLKNMSKNQKQKQKHYNVAYVKHNRFLSSGQKKTLITPKVTQMIPAKSPPHKIYGKPKVKIDELFQCPFHTDVQQNKIKFPKKNQYQQPIQDNNKYLNDQQIQAHKLYEIHQSKAQNDVSKKIQDSDSHIIYVDKIVKVQSKTPIKILNSPKSKTSQYSDDNYMSVKTKTPIKVINSPKYVNSQYSDDDYLRLKAKTKMKKKKEAFNKNVESRIKYLIDKDKKNKLIQKQLKRQENKIKELQKKMLQSQKRKTKLLINQQLFMKDDLSYSSSGFSQVDREILNYKKKLQQQKTFSKNKYKNYKQIQQPIAQGSQFSDFNHQNNKSSYYQQDQQSDQQIDEENDNQYEQQEQQEQFSTH